MHQQEFCEIKRHMLSHMKDSTHDPLHIERVLYAALDIAQTLEPVRMDVLIAACLLHDIGRERQFEDPSLCHARVGGDMAYEYLLSKGWKPEKADHVRQCVAAHRYRGGAQPQSIEAKILYDADKLDVTGALGIARTLIYGGQTGEPLYILDEQGHAVTQDGGEEQTTFFQEYNDKLKNLYGSFYTARAQALAAHRQQAAQQYYQALYQQVRQNQTRGKALLDAALGRP